MRIDKGRFLSGAYGAIFAMCFIFGTKSCVTVIGESIENRGKRMVCSEAIEKNIYRELESCKP